MLVTVFHNPDARFMEYKPEHGLVRVFACNLDDYTARYTDHADVLEHLFHALNVGDDPDFCNPPMRIAVDYRSNRLRSLSVGDVISLDGTMYACAPSGWVLLPIHRPTDTTTDNTSAPWCVTESDGSILDRFFTEDEAREALLTGEYPDDAEMAYVNEPDIIG